MWDEIPVHFLKMNSFSLQILLHFVGEKAVPDNSGPVTDQYRPALLTRKKITTKTQMEETVATHLSFAQVGYQGSSFTCFCQDNSALGIPTNFAGLALRCLHLLPFEEESPST